MIEIRGYIDEQGNKRFADWLMQLDTNAAARVTTALTRIEQGNLSNVKSVGGGVFEYKIDFGPGYRIYFGRDGDRLVILIGGGSKSRQSKDIAAAKDCWADYKRRKKQEIHSCRLPTILRRRFGPALRSNRRSGKPCCARRWSV